MTTLAAWRPATAYAKGATVRPNAAQSSAPVPILNGGFNSGDTAWTKDTGWAINTGDTYEGTYKAEFTGTGSGRIKTSGTYPATAGQVITATVKAKVSDEADGATALLLWYDSSNVLISTSTGLESSVETGVWMQLEVAGVAPDAAAFVTFAVEATRTVGTRVLIDDARWTYSAPIEARRTAYRAVQDAAGVSGVTEPTWPTTLGARVNDGTVIWEAVEVSWIEWTAQPIIESGTTEPVWPTTVGAFVRDGTANWECVSRRVEDEKCPNTKVVCIINSKVFAVDEDIVRYSATAMPLDWSTASDAGYLPTGLQQANANDMAVLFPYRGNLCAWNANCFQMWQTDPDPTQMALLDQMDGIGSTHPLAARAVGNDLYFLSNQGVRSVGIANAAQNLQAGDVGMPIDVLVQAAMVQWAIDGNKALSTYWPSMGQYWLCGGDDGVTAGSGGALALACPTLIEITAGVPYSYTYVATGGTAPYTFSIASGALPTGLTLNASTGVLSGTVLTPGSYSFGVQVTDALGVVAFCGWAAEVLEDEVEVVPAQLLITGSGSTPFIYAEATATPTFAAIDPGTGADVAQAACSVNSEGVWIVVGASETVYSTDITTAWSSVAAVHGTIGRFGSYGPSGWLLQHLGASHTGLLAHASSVPTDLATLTINISGGATRTTLSMTAYTNGMYYGSVGFESTQMLLACATIGGTWNVITTDSTSIPGGSGDGIRFFHDIKEFDGALYASVYVATGGGFATAVGQQVRRSHDGGATWPDKVVDGAVDTTIPLQLCAGDGVLLIVNSNVESVYTSADGFAATHSTGTTRSAEALPRNEVEGRNVAYAGGRFYIMGDSGVVSTVDGTAFSGVSSYPGTFNTPISIAGRSGA